MQGYNVEVVSEPNIEINLSRAKVRSLLHSVCNPSDFNHRHTDLFVFLLFFSWFLLHFFFSQGCVFYNTNRRHIAFQRNTQIVAFNQRIFPNSTTSDFTMAPANPHASSTRHSNHPRDFSGKTATHTALGLGLALGIAALLACASVLVFMLRRRWRRLEEEKQRTYCEGSKTTKEDTNNRNLLLGTPFSGLSSYSIVSRLSIRSKRSNYRNPSVAYTSLNGYESSTLPFVPEGPPSEITESDIPPPTPPKPSGLQTRRKDSEIGPLPSIRPSVRPNIQRMKSSPAFLQQSTRPSSAVTSAGSVVGWMRMADNSMAIPVAELRRTASDVSSQRIEQQMDKYSVISERAIRPGHIATCLPAHGSPVSPLTVASAATPRTFRAPTDMVTCMEVLLENHPTPPRQSYLISPVTVAELPPIPPAELAPPTPRVRSHHEQQSLGNAPHILSSHNHENAPLLPAQPATPETHFQSPTIEFVDDDVETRYSSDDDDALASTFDTNMSLRFKQSGLLTTSMLPPMLPPLSPQTTFSMSSSTAGSRPATRAWYDASSVV